MSTTGSKEATVGEVMRLARAEGPFRLEWSGNDVTITSEIGNWEVSLSGDHFAVWVRTEEFCPHCHAEMPFYTHSSSIPAIVVLAEDAMKTLPNHHSMRGFLKANGAELPYSSAAEEPG